MKTTRPAQNTAPKLCLSRSLSGTDPHVAERMRRAQLAAQYAVAAGQQANQELPVSHIANAY